MTAGQKELVRLSFAALLPHGGAMALRFYERLFAEHPEYRALFLGDIGAQRVKFVDMLQVTVDSMDRLDKVVVAMWQLGKRHGGYGVRPEDYAPVGGALLAALAETSAAEGIPFGPEHHAAWESAYDLMAAVMQQAAAEGAIPRPGSRG